MLSRSLHARLAAADRSDDIHEGPGRRGSIWLHEDQVFVHWRTGSSPAAIGPAVMLASPGMPVFLRRPGGRGHAADGQRR
jgi:hypothetical protein